MKNNYKKELLTAIALARTATNAILDIYYGRMVTTFKEDKSPVTNADIRANKIILEGLQREFPLDGIISEELADITITDAVITDDAGIRKWYIDPIDGTRGFTERNDQFAIHIGLTEQEKSVLGLVFKPVSGECFYGILGQGAYCVSPKGVETKLSVRREINNESLDIIIDKNMLFEQKWNYFLRSLHVRRVMVNGSEGLRVMKVAEGIADFHITETENKCCTWDICAPQIIAEEAGAIVRYISGLPIIYTGQRKLGQQFIVAANQKLADYICDKINKI